MKYDFDEIIDRSRTASVKLDLLPDGAVAGSLPLWVADMDFVCAKPILEALRRRIDHGIFGYTYYDYSVYQNAIIGWFKKRFDWEVDSANIFFSPGVVPAFSILIHLLTEPGDGVIIQKPVYYPFTNRIEAGGRKVVNNPLIYQNGRYLMDYDDLEIKLMNPSNKGILFCSPHNPVGRVWTEAELVRLVGLCKKYGKWIISDEIHSDLTRKGVVHHPLAKLATDYQEQIIICTAPSKTFNLAGMHTSNIVIFNQDYQQRWKSFVDEELSVGSCNPLGMEAMTAAYTDGEEWLEQLREYLDGNIEFVKSYLARYLPQAVVIETQGTYLMWIDFNAYCRDQYDLEEKMHKQARVALDEGYIFGQEGAGFERINIASPRKMIAECMERIYYVLKK